MNTKQMKMKMKLSGVTYICDPISLKVSLNLFGVELCSTCGDQVVKRCLFAHDKSQYVCKSFEVGCKDENCTFLHEKFDSDRIVLASSVKKCMFGKKCNKGFDCKFDHTDVDGDVDVLNIVRKCMFGKDCRNGTDCKFTHDVDVDVADIKKCRFGVNCKRLDCKFAHDVVVDVVMDAVVPVNIPKNKITKNKIIKCKFGPECTRKSTCKFDHGAVIDVVQSVVVDNNNDRKCRFGRSCKKPDCKFTHRDESVNVNVFAKPIKKCKFGKDCKNENCKFDHAMNVIEGTVKDAVKDNIRKNVRGNVLDTKEFKTENVFLRALCIDGSQCESLVSGSDKMCPDIHPMNVQKNTTSGILEVKKEQPVKEVLRKVKARKSVLKPCPNGDKCESLIDGSEHMCMYKHPWKYMLMMKGDVKKETPVEEFKKENVLLRLPCAFGAKCESLVFGSSKKCGDRHPRNMENNKIEMQKSIFV